MATRDLGSRLAVSEEVLTEWISAQRWFGAKARDVAQFNVLDVVVLRREPPALALTIVEARFGAGTHELYHVPIGMSSRCSARSSPGSTPSSRCSASSPATASPTSPSSKAGSSTAGS
ncbi:MAG: hypothetical protein LC720_02140 [Actinobacteria bacterium]|nr:hypothetical protein [Actinomycetota bacterium]